MTDQSEQKQSRMIPPPPYYICHKCNIRGHWMQDCPYKVPPSHYICHKCNISGHWIQDCPSNNTGTKPHNSRNSASQYTYKMKPRNQGIFYKRNFKSKNQDVVYKSDGTSVMVNAPPQTKGVIYHRSPPPNYVCHKCNISGHWIQDCQSKNIAMRQNNDMSVLQKDNWEREREKVCLLGNNRKPISKLGAGDTELRYNILPENIGKNAFYVLKDEITWFTMKHKEGLVPRLVSNQGIVYNSNHNIDFEPIYRHPATEQPIMCSFTPFVDKIRKVCQKQAGHVLNHALIQYYRNGRDYISQHSDKTIDIDQSSKIVNFSVGATRVMLLKKKKETCYDRNMNYIRNNQRINVVNNSVLMMGLKTNKLMYHTIVKDRRQRHVKREDELSYNEGRISITFRKIGTFKSITNPKNVLIGQGAKWNNKYSIINVFHDRKYLAFNKNNVNFSQLTEEEQRQEFRHLIHMFGDENRKAQSFDWNRAYGKGFRFVF